MKNTNTMGGILFAYIIGKDDLSLFAVHNDVACVRIAPHKTYTLPTSTIIPSPGVTPEETDAGIIYKHTASIRFSPSLLTHTDIDEIRRKIRSGCILIGQDTNGHKQVYGTPAHPMMGTLTKIIGKQPADFTGYELKLSATSQYPMLKYMEI